MRREDVGKEVMIAIPVALVVQRHDKEVAPLQGLQLRGASFLAGDGIAQRAMQPLEHSGLEQEAADTLRLPLQDLVDQIVRDVAVVSRERPDEPSDILGALQGQSRQLQAGNPAFGTVFQGGDIGCREVKPHHLIEEYGGFGGGKTQVGGAQFGQLAPGAQPGQGKLGIFAGGNDQVQLRRQVLEQKGEGLVNRLGVNQVVVVEDEDETVRQGGESH